MAGIQQMEQFIILIQTQQRTHGFGQDHLLEQLENIDFVNETVRDSLEMSQEEIIQSNLKM